MQIWVHVKSHIMSDLNVPETGSSSAPDQGNILKSAGKTQENVDDFASKAESAINYNCDDDDDDKDVIVAKIQKGCEYKTIEPTNKESSSCLDRQLDKMHINSKDSIKGLNTGIGDQSKRQYLKSVGTKPKIHSGGAKANQNIKADNDKNVEILECKNLNKSKESRIVQTVMAQSSTSGNDSPYSVRDSPQKSIDTIPVRMGCLQKNLPILLKSQSLDLYNDDCGSFTVDQQFRNRLLPNIEECRPFESEIQSSSTPSTEETQQCQVDNLDKSTGETRQRPIHRPNIAASICQQQSTETRPIYPNVPYSPYGSPYGSPRSVRRRPPLRESRRISIEKSGSFLQLNQYKLMDQIGQGSYGLVKLAYSEEDSTHYAMKILSKKRLLRQAAFMRRGPKQTTSPLDRVYREIAVLKKLDHPNVVKLVEVLDDPLEDSLYMVFEWVKKGEVLSIPTDKPLPEDRAWSVFRDCLLGLEYLHYQKIIHADLKPGNLLLTECGHVKIADLGVCNEFLGEDAIMSNGSTGGTPAFRAPETLVLGKNVYCGRAADVWALGATLYSLVYGNVPFLATSIPILYEKIKNDAVVLPDTPIISGEIKHCILRMLEKDPTYRINLPQLKVNPWVTKNGAYPLPTEDENCCLVQVDDEDINSVVRSIPKLDTLILIKTMLKNHSFGNPFMKNISGRASQPGGSRLEKFAQSGRSNSAPGSYHMALEREPSMDSVLPALSEHCSSKQNEEM
ncbi:calcium/calmodulin-dependent protein kinase kinase 1 [Drosophila grimshawi]|uniref:calcium/calmodulin-dependent protein kinase kinase 1 n=1 Tax=Drosophila grimshawi TaxID=7222 RepID=UPI000C86FAE3|nr:calcium/calmodulin-dependent protein kinase kinase 1 [Drosophila grimshawi]